MDSFPECFDLVAAKEAYPILYSQSLNTILNQELERFNKLNAFIVNSLDNIIKGIDGTILLSKELEYAAK